MAHQGHLALHHRARRLQGLQVAPGAQAHAAQRNKGEESLTDLYDKKAFAYLLPPLLLTVISYSVYSLLTGYHRGWYAWLLESLVALVYGCGFIVMTPQLFINYR